MTQENWERSYEIWFPRGLIGLQDLRRFTLWRGEDGSPFSLIQSDDRPSMRFPLIDPLVIRSDYEIEFPPELLEELEVDVRSDLEVYSLLTVPEGAMEMSVNLRAPILISRTSGVATQVLLSDENLPVAALLHDELEREKAEMLL